MVCIICRFAIEPDDIANRSESGRVICLRCWHRETNTTQPMPKGLRREIEADLDNLARESKWGI